MRPHCRLPYPAETKWYPSRASATAYVANHLVDHCVIASLAVLCKQSRANKTRSRLANNTTACLPLNLCTRRIRHRLRRTQRHRAPGPDTPCYDVFECCLHLPVPKAVFECPRAPISTRSASETSASLSFCTPTDYYLVSIRPRTLRKIWLHLYARRSSPPARLCRTSRAQLGPGDAATNSWQPLPTSPI
jgi:hypothetical protein